MCYIAINTGRDIPITKANKMHYFSNLLDKVLYMFRTGPLSIIRSISTLYTQQQVFVMLVLLASASLVRRELSSQNYLTLRRLMSYIYGAPILDVSRSHTTTQHSR